MEIGGLDMGCKVLSEREGMALADIVGANDQPAKVLRAVDISDNCPDLDLDTRVVLTYVRNRHRHLVVRVSIEKANGEEIRRWKLQSVRSKNFAYLRGFKDFAHEVTLPQAVLGNLIIEKAPRGS